MGRGHFHLGAAFVLLLLALSLGSLMPVPGAPPPRLPDLRIRGTKVDLQPVLDLGPCPVPSATCDVVRQGLDLDGLPTWWHRDGTVVKVASERVRGVNGEELLIPVVVTRQG